MSTLMMGMALGAPDDREVVLGHVVMLPNASLHLTLRRVTAVDLILAATIASVGLNQRVIVERVAQGSPDLRRWLRPDLPGRLRGWAPSCPPRRVA
jgi:hypothetical protein